MTEVTLDRRSVAHSRADDYALTPIPEPRPAAGWVGSLVECIHCGEPVQCRVYSVADTQRLRTRWRRVTRLLVVAPILMIVADALSIAGHMPDKAASGPVAFLVGFSAFGIAGCVLVAMETRKLARKDDGVRLAKRLGRHSLQWTSIKFSD